MAKPVPQSHPEKHLRERRRAGHRGMYDVPDQIWQKVAARKAVLLALIDKCPDVIADLHDDVVMIDIDLKPMIAAARQRLVAPREPRWESRMDDVQAQDAAKAERRCLDLTNAQRWALRSNLNAPWVVEWAVSVTAERRHRSEWGRQVLTSLQNRNLERFIAFLRNVLETYGWQETTGIDLFGGPGPHAVTPKPEEESESAFMNRARAAYRVARAGRGLIPRPGRPKLSKHAEWLVLHQVKELTEAAIAELDQDERGLDVATISKAVTSLAKLIGLLLRPARRRVRSTASDPSR